MHTPGEGICDGDVRTGPDRGGTAGGGPGRDAPHRDGPPGGEHAGPHAGVHGVPAGHRVLVLPEPAVSGPLIGRADPGLPRPLLIVLVAFFVVLALFLVLLFVFVLRPVLLFGGPLAVFHAGLLFLFVFLFVVFGFEGGVGARRHRLRSGLLRRLLRRRLLERLLGVRQRLLVLLVTARSAAGAGPSMGGPPPPPSFSAAVDRTGDPVGTSKTGAYA